MRGITYYEPLKQSGWVENYKGRQGPTLFKRYDEKLVFNAAKPLWDLGDVAASGASISSAVYTAGNGLGVASTGEGTTSCYATITKTGSVEITATMDTGRIFQRIFYFEGLDENESDY